MSIFAWSLHGTYIRNPVYCVNVTALIPVNRRYFSGRRTPFLGNSSKKMTMRKGEFVSDLVTRPSVALHQCSVLLYLNFKFPAQNSREWGRILLARSVSDSISKSSGPHFSALDQPMTPKIAPVKLQL